MFTLCILCSLVISFMHVMFHTSQKEGMWSFPAAREKCMQIHHHTGKGKDIQWFIKDTQSHTQRLGTCELSIHIAHSMTGCAWVCNSYTPHSTAMQNAIWWQCKMLTLPVASQCKKPLVELSTILWMFVSAKAGRETTRCCHCNAAHQEEQRLLQKHSYVWTSRNRKDHVRQGKHLWQLMLVRD